MNFCYVNKDTVQFYLHQRASIPEFNPTKQVMEEKLGGCVLIFKFVRMDGVSRDCMVQNH